MEKVKNGFGKLSDGIKSFVSDNRVVVARLFFFAAFSVIIFFAVAIIFSMVLHSGLSLRGMQPTDLPGTPATGALSVGEVTVDYEETLPPERVFTYEFITDLSAYEEYMNPTDRDGYLQLINYENYLDQNYKPDDLVNVPTRGDRDVQKLRLYPARALEALMAEAKACGVLDFTVTSGWRGYWTQDWLLKNQISKYTPTMSYDDAYALAITEVAIPGTSEHQSGLCVDMHNLPGADISYAKTESAKWLAANCYKFGFILRYPKDKTEITKISFEPWHFRYVGRYHASMMNELGMCLEEYIAFIGSEEQI